MMWRSGGQSRDKSHDLRFKAADCECSRKRYPNVILVSGL